MEWKGSVEPFRRFKKVIVSGPQRSGTTITAKILAHELKYQFLPEERICHDNSKMMSLVMDVGRYFVLQCPAMSHALHHWHGTPDLVVFFMHRHPDEIIASQERIKWTHDKHEAFKYNASLDEPICKIKYRHWHNEQLPLFARGAATCVNMPYGSFEGHDMWVDAPNRADFRPRQTA